MVVESASHWAATIRPVLGRVPAFSISARTPQIFASPSLALWRSTPLARDRVLGQGAEGVEANPLRQCAASMGFTLSNVKEDKQVRKTR